MVKIYHNPRCTKSRQALELLQSKGIAPQVALYLEHGLTKTEIKEILSKLKLSARDIMRTKEDEFCDQNLGDKNLSEEDLIAAIVKTPKLLERPIVINGNKAAIGRPTENILEILDQISATKITYTEVKAALIEMKMTKEFPPKKPSKNYAKKLPKNKSRGNRQSNKIKKTVS